MSLSGNGSLLKIGDKRVLRVTIRCWGRVFRCPRGCKLCARAFLVTNKTFCIDQTKSLVDLYALKWESETVKMLIFMNFDGFRAKWWIFMVFRISVTNLRAYNSTKLCVWSIQNVLLVTRNALAHSLHPPGHRNTRPHNRIVSGKTRFSSIFNRDPLPLSDTFG